MNRTNVFLLVSCLFFLSLISACRTTEAQLRNIPPSMLERYAPAEKVAILAPTPPKEQTKLHWFLLSAAVLAGVIMVFATDRDRGEAKKQIPAKRSTIKKRKRART